MTVWMLGATAWAGEWAHQEIDPKANVHWTAYTIGKRNWEIGLVNQDYGLLDNLQVGTTLALWPLGAPNVHGKVTAIRSRKFDVALESGYTWTGLARFGVPDGSVHMVPIDAIASWEVSRRFSIHLGWGWTLVGAKGELQSKQIADGIDALTGFDLGPTLNKALGDQGGLYGGANLTLYRQRLGLEYRFNRRDSLVFSDTTFVSLRGCSRPESPPTAWARATSTSGRAPRRRSGCPCTTS